MWTVRSGMWTEAANRTIPHKICDTGKIARVRPGRNSAEKMQTFPSQTASKITYFQHIYEQATRMSDTAPQQTTTNKENGSMNVGDAVTVHVHGEDRNALVTHITTNDTTDNPPLLNVVTVPPTGAPTDRYGAHVEYFTNVRHTNATPSPTPPNDNQLNTPDPTWS